MRAHHTTIMITPTDKIHAAEALRADGWSTRRIASALGVSQRTVQDWLARNRELAESVNTSCKAFREQSRILGE